MIKCHLLKHYDPQNSSFRRLVGVMTCESRELGGMACDSMELGVMACDSMSSLASQFTVLGEFQSSKTPYLKKKTKTPIFKRDK